MSLNDHADIAKRVSAKQQKWFKLKYIRESKTINYWTLFLKFGLLKTRRKTFHRCEIIKMSELHVCSCASGMHRTWWHTSCIHHMCKKYKNDPMMIPAVLSNVRKDDILHSQHQGYQHSLRHRNHVPLLLGKRKKECTCINTTDLDLYIYTYISGAVAKPTRQLVRMLSCVYRPLKNQLVK